MELTKEGYLERVKGKGTYVSRPKLEANFIQKLESFHAQMLALGVQPMTKVIRLEIVPAIPAVNAALNIPDSEELVLLIRLCFGDNSPIALMESYLPAKRFAGIVHEDLTNYSLYIIFAKSFHTTVTRVTRQIEAINASQREAEYLGIQKGKAICLVHNTAYDQDNIIAEYNIAYYRGERSKFTMELKQ
jgi:GntR family transcriptional regulator